MTSRRPRCSRTLADRQQQLLLLLLSSPLPCGEPCADSFSRFVVHSVLRSTPPPPPHVNNNRNERARRTRKRTIGTESVSYPPSHSVVRVRRHGCFLLFLKSVCVFIPPSKAKRARRAVDNLLFVHKRSYTARSYRRRGRSRISDRRCYVARAYALCGCRALTLIGLSNITYEEPNGFVE